MAMIVPLPRSVRSYLSQNTHLGLQLDKYVESWDDTLFATPGDRGSDRDTGKLSERVQKPTIQTLVSLSKSEPPGLDYAKLAERWHAVVAAKEGISFRAETVGPFTLHLARASALENAGICLHPIYGFVYLPGTGLKGMARAYAETVWLPAQPAEKQPSAGQLINDVFGWASDATEEASAGQIVFFDAWPEQWTPLVGDILNNHHPSYYQNQEPPGDWDSPVPVYFLAVPAGHTFRFAVAKRRADVSEELLNLAIQWLVGALEYEGAGAKTASGYGAFKVTTVPEQLSAEQVRKTWQTAVEKKRRAEFSCELELVTPAFLAGPNQGEEDCDLRPATLRGMLRWWWRTMHAGHVDAKTLARLEAAVWGSTERGSPVRITVARIGDMSVEPFMYKREGTTRSGRLRLEPDDERLGSLGIVLARGYTTQGLFYAAYGMDEVSHGQRRTRYWVHPPARWAVRIVTRPGCFTSDEAAEPLPAQILLEQAQAALWLLTHYGGVGSRWRKGFGSFKDLVIETIDSMEKIKVLADKFRTSCGLSEQVKNARDAESPSLAKCILWPQVNLPWRNPYRALDEVAQAYEDTALAPKDTGHGKHCPEKLALGLPRQIHGPLPNPLPHQKNHQPPEKLMAFDRSGKKLDRHASPILLHFAKTADKSLALRVIAFPSSLLGGFETNQAFLSNKFLPYFMTKLRARIQDNSSPNDTVPNVSLTHTARHRKQSSEALPEANNPVVAILLEEKTKKGGWKARLAKGDPTPGPIVNNSDVPADVTPGQEVTLIVSSITLASDGSIRAIQFRWPTTQNSGGNKRR